MENIETVTNQGLIKKGRWNGKYYASVKTGKLDNAGMVRIYVDNDMVHCKKEDIKIIKETASAKVTGTKICHKCGTYCYGDCEAHNG
jgi:hypothetical protein